MSESTTRCGAITIIGKPNVGKSTLMNAILGSKLSIVSHKPQTTRKNVLGIWTKDNSQIVFLDTPGILTPRYELQRSMMGYVRSAISDSDAVLVIADATDKKFGISYLPDDFSELLKFSKKPTFLIINKMDALHDKKVVLPIISALKQQDVFQEFFTVSAKHNLYVSDMLDALARYMPHGEFIHDPNFLSTLPERFFVSELVREIVFHEYHDEIPYSAEVQIAEFKERGKGKWYIAAEIIVERDTQKAIIIGKGGIKLRTVGTKARLSIEEHLQTEVFLEFFVKVREDWRDKTTFLRGFGY